LLLSNAFGVNQDGIAQVDIIHLGHAQVDIAQVGPVQVGTA
jgi:hypothetical protein